MRGRILWLALALGAISPRHAAADVDAEIRAHEEAFVRACTSGDVDATKALYADDARLVWPGAGDEARGKDQIEKVLARGCRDVKDRKLTLRSLDVIPLGTDHVATVGQWDDAFTTPEGKHVSGQIRTTEVLVKQGGAWKYLVDHASIGLPATPPRRPQARRPPRRRA